MMQVLLRPMSASTARYSVPSDWSKRIGIAHRCARPSASLNSSKRPHAVTVIIAGVGADLQG